MSSNNGDSLSLSFFVSGRVKSGFLVASFLFLLFCIIIYLRSPPLKGTSRIHVLKNFSASTWGSVGPRDDYTREPMVLSLSYWEQFGNALKNLFDLQCWAKSVNIRCVLEPAIPGGPSHSAFRFQENPSVNLRDVVNLDSWNKLSTRFDYSITVSMDEFFKHASRKAIYVQLQYNGGFRCKSLDEIASAEWFKVLRKNDFVLETACINTKMVPFTSDVFIHKIFQHHLQSRNMTVIFDEWRGIKSTNFLRLNLSDSKCQHYLKHLMMPEVATALPMKIGYPKMNDQSDSLSPLIPSKKVLAVADLFLAKYMSQMQYIAIAVRTEKLRTVSIPEKNSNCTKDIFSDYRHAFKDKNISSVLLFKDYGVHGSKSHRNPSIGAVELISSLEQWTKSELSSNSLDKAIADVAGIENSVFIAMVVSTLIARADCVVLAGGGAFQSQILNMYAHNHRGSECYYYRDSDCLRTYINHYNT